MIDDQLRDFIADSGHSILEISKAAKIAPSVLRRFVNRQRGLTLESAAAIAEVLEVKLIEAPKSRRLARRK